MDKKRGKGNLRLWLKGGQVKFLFFACIEGDGVCERGDIICFFPDLEETKGGALCKENNVKNWKEWLEHLIKQRKTMVSTEGHTTGEEETAEEIFHVNLRNTK